MNKICDRRAELIGLSGQTLICHLRIWKEEIDGERAPVVVVVVTEVPDNPGASVTNAAELIASQVLSLYRLEPDQVLWFEHYGLQGVGYTREAETFDRVQFTVLPEPRWAGLGYGDLYITLDDPCWMSSSRRAVEMLIGETFGED